MNLSYNWLRELSGTALEARLLADRLTRVGLAVDEVRQVGDDFVLDFDLTSNRPDCLSHLGVAREIAVIEGRSLDRRNGDSMRIKPGQQISSVEILDSDLCPRYAARIVRGVRIGPSPPGLSKRLEVIGQRPINNVADITNYVLHELGQPLHAFDLAKLSEMRIIVRRARPGERITTLDGVERELDDQMLVIADAAGPVAVAGIMGGKATEISDDTRDVLIESAYFDPHSVRRTARRLGLNTEASYRFERGTDYANVLRAQDHAVALICEIAGGDATESAIDIYPKPIVPPVVPLRFDRVDALTSISVSTDSTLRILTTLGFVPLSRNSKAVAGPESQTAVREIGGSFRDDQMSFVTPTWRVDVDREEDLVEEVARHAGYELIASDLPPATEAGEYSPGESRKRAVRLSLTASGFDEAISLSFISASHDERFALFPGITKDTPPDREGLFVTLRNAIIEDASRMRATLLPGLVEAVRRNLNHGLHDVRLFELGRVFLAPGEKGNLPDEHESLAMVATGRAVEEGRAGDRARDLDFYDLKGAVEDAIRAVNIPPLDFRQARVTHLRPGQAAEIVAPGGGVVGTIGRLAEHIAALFKFRQPVYVAEMDLGRLLSIPEQKLRYTRLPRFPPVVRDLTIHLNRRVPYSSLPAAVAEAGGEICRSAVLIDVYEGSGVSEDERSITLRIEYRSPDRTLRDEEVEAAHSRIVKSLSERFNAQQSA